MVSVRVSGSQGDVGAHQKTEMDSRVGREVSVEVLSREVTHFK